jgi:murein DD-endopeptidase MepM/ murein hydrolase activator NlpD
MGHVRKDTVTMEIIVLHTSGRRTQLPTTLVNWLVGLLMVAIGVAFWAGTRYISGAMAVPAAGPIKLWQKDLESQRSEVIAAILRAEDELRSIESQIARIEAALMMSESLANTLAERAKVEIAPKPTGGAPLPVALTPSLHARANQLIGNLRLVEQRLRDRVPRLEALRSIVVRRDLAAATKPAGRPIGQGWRSSPFGYRADPVTGRRVLHRGLDYAAKPGSPILAVASGIVADVGVDNGYGRYVEIAHGEGIVTRYAHNKENLVSPGTVVERGSMIARVGSSGRTTGPHVHYEVLVRGRAVNPAEYVAKAAVRPTFSD